MNDTQMLHNTVIELSAAKMSRELTKDETLLHAQACRTLQSYYRGLEMALCTQNQKNEDRLYGETQHVS